MRVLVAYADDDGTSAGTARLIGETLQRQGLQSVVCPVESARTDGFDAVVLGSTARAGHWRGRAVQFALAQGGHLRRLPVWLFSNSPAADVLMPERPIDIGPVEEAVVALDHRPFLAAAASARSWTPHALVPDSGEVCCWAGQIAARLHAQEAPSGT